MPSLEGGKSTSSQNKNHTINPGPVGTNNGQGPWNNSYQKNAQPTKPESDID